MVGRLARVVTLAVVWVILLSGCSAGGASSVRQAGGRAPVGSSANASFPVSDGIGAYLAGLARRGRLSGAVLVARGPDRFAQAYGMADRGTSVPNTVQTMYRLGSVTKQFTAMAVLLLQRQHRLTVEDRVCRYLDPCPPDWAPITIQELLTHSSGIPDDLGELGYGWPPRAESPAGLVAEFRNAPLHFAPGTRMRYSNSGYVLLGYLVERITGQSYAGFLQREIFDPLGMAHTGFDTTRIRAGHAVGYYADGHVPEPYPMTALYAAGALYSTVTDMQRWDDALQQDTLLPASVMRQMFTPHVPCPPAGSPGGCLLPTDVGYGYGWFIAHEPQGVLDQHVGHIDGYVSFNGIYPDSHLHIVVLANSESTNVLGVGRHLAALVDAARAG